MDWALWRLQKTCSNAHQQGQIIFHHHGCLFRVVLPCDLRSSGSVQAFIIILETQVRMMHQLWNTVDVTILPPYVPSEAERQDANLYAANVRKLYADRLEVPLIDEVRPPHFPLYTAANIAVIMMSTRYLSHFLEFVCHPGLLCTSHQQACCQVMHVMPLLPAPLSLSQCISCFCIRLHVERAASYNGLVSRLCRAYQSTQHCATWVSECHWTAVD